jgi:hypothetical protein
MIFFALKNGSLASAVKRVIFFCLKFLVVLFEYCNVKNAINTSELFNSLGLEHYLKRGDVARSEQKNKEASEDDELYDSDMYELDDDEEYDDDSFKDLLEQNKLELEQEEDEEIELSLKLPEFSSAVLPLIYDDVIGNFGKRLVNFVDYNEYVRHFPHINILISKNLFFFKALVHKRFLTTRVPLADIVSQVKTQNAQLSIRDILFKKYIKNDSFFGDRNFLRPCFDIVQDLAQESGLP